MMSRRTTILALFALLVLAGIGIFGVTALNRPSAPVVFDGQRALQDVNIQCNFGPRIPGSAAHQQTVDWIHTQLNQAGWAVEIQTGTALGHPYQNIVAKRGSGKPWIILGAHYDTRMMADQDPDPSLRNKPVPGANDGASGVAVLVELARVLPKDLHAQVWLVFFDIEDQGDIPNWDWILGSQAFAQSLSSPPDAVVVLDMIGDANLNIYKERNSNTELSNQIWNEAAKIGYGQQFINQPKYAMLDDHTPFLQRGYPAVDIIDFDYPYWHTTADTPDKLSAASLKVVGETLYQWIISQ